MPACAFALVLACARCFAWESFTDKIAASGGLEIGTAEARALEAKLGQLFIVNVDGFGYSGSLALAPGFVSMVKKLQVGGVIPHYGSTDFERIRRTNRALARLTELPLLICSDIVKLSAKAVKPVGSVGAQAPGVAAVRKVVSFGDGYVGGFIGRFRSLDDREFGLLAALNAFVFTAMGVNVALGPTIDDSTGDSRTSARARAVIDQLSRFGIQPVLKHFPFLPTDANLHRESPDVKVSRAMLEKRISIFKDLRGESSMLMTTHLRDSLVDVSIVTFSPAWMDILRRATRFKGLTMTDGLLMLKNYPDANALVGGPPADETAAKGGTHALGQTAAWAARAILAGHDFIILEGSAAQSSEAFEGMLASACRNTDTGKKLRARIGESYDRIVGWKKSNDDLLRREVEVPLNAVELAISLAPHDGADVKAFRLDQAAFSSLAPSMKKAEAAVSLLRD